MSNRTTRFAARSSLALSAAALLICAPSATAARVELGTSSAFVVLAGSAVTNTGPSVLNGALGVSPGTSLSGFGLPAVVNGATHAGNAVAAQAMADATTAFGVAATEPVSPANVLTGTDLGSRTLIPGVYGYSSSAQLTGALTLDAGGDPDAQFIFQIGSTLTTASASSVVLTNGASACNVFWQIGSSATLGTGTAFQGNLLAAASITATTGSSLVGRALAQAGAVSLDTNVLTAPTCTTPVGPNPTPGPGSTPTPTPTPSAAPGAPQQVAPTPTAPPTGNAAPGGTDGSQNPGGQNTGGGSTPSPELSRAPGDRCVDPFRARVRGAAIASVRFRLDGKLIATRSSAPFTVVINARPGSHRLTALVSFTDGRIPKHLRLQYRACAEVTLMPRRGPSVFTG